MEMNGDVSNELEAKGFTILDFIGQGGYAKVYKCLWDQYPNSIFVAKVISIPEDLKSKEDATYMNEINTLKHLYHKNIILIYRHFTISDFLVIIMEYCENGTLSDYIKTNGPMKDEQFRMFALECMEAVAFCHEKNVAHRDIKPSNFLIDKNFHIKLSDFGLADLCRSELTTRRDGSLTFAPPEMIMGKAYEPKKADIWALGITFYYLLSGKLPWTGITKEEVKTEIIYKSIEFESKEISQKISKLIYAMTKKIPDDRISADLLVKDPFFSVLPRLPSITKKIPRSNSKPINKSLSWRKSTPSPIPYALSSTNKLFPGCGRLPQGCHSRHTSVVC